MRLIDVTGYELVYSVSDAGQVWSHNKSDWMKQYWRQCGRKTKYLVVYLYKDGKRRYKKVHHLVLRAFVGDCPVGMEGCHKDDNRSNNNIDNLYWGTRLQNRQDRLRNHHS